MTGEKLATILEAYHADKWGYVLGANGEYYTPELADKWERTRGKSPGYFTRDCAHWYNHYVADCSGSIVSAMRSEQSKYTDRTANGFKSQFVQSGAISTIPEIRGLAVWKDGHIGIYISLNQTIAHLFF